MRPPTRQLTITFVLRTLARVQMLTRLDQKQLAEVLAEENLLALAPKVSSSFAVAPMRPAEPKSN